MGNVATSVELPNLIYYEIDKENNVPRMICWVFYLKYMQFRTLDATFIAESDWHESKITHIDRWQKTQISSDGLDYHVLSDGTKHPKPISLISDEWAGEKHYADRSQNPPIPGFTKISKDEFETAWKQLDLAIDDGVEVVNITDKEWEKKMKERRDHSIPYGK